MISVEDFPDFFEAIHGPGVRPYRWQRNLLAHLAERGTWPEGISAPTGAGKSSVVEIHVFANALAAIGAGARVPRRMAVVVNRRALTDSHTDRARRIAERLRAAVGDPGVLGEAARALLSLEPDDVEDRRPLTVAAMRGGLVTDREWLNRPSACAVLGMTPAMWGSSILFRSYGAPRRARPRLAGLLALDSVMVLDEAHLNRQLLVTARRAADLARPSADKLHVPGLDVVAVSATPPEADERGLRILREDLAEDEELAQRLLAPKDAIYVPVDAWPANGRPTKHYLDALVEQVVGAATRVRQAEQPGCRTVGCVVNRVETAVKVTERLRKDGLECRLWVGRMRPWDLQQLRAQEPGLFTVEGQPGVDVLVATQTVEVGIDLDLAAMVTELASGSALAQRVGRVNRRGLRGAGEVIVVGPPEDNPITRDLLPYAAEDLTAARDWIVGRSGEDGGLGALRLSEVPSPSDKPRRILWQRPEPWNVSLWAKTSMDLFVEPELELWLQDDLSPDDSGAGVVLREIGDLPDRNAVETLIAAVPPQDTEAYPANVRTLRQIVSTLPENIMESAFLWRRGQFVDEWPASEAEDSVASIQPGDILVVSVKAPVLNQGVVSADGASGGLCVPPPELEGIAEIIVDPDRLGELSKLRSEDLEERFPGSIVECSFGPLGAPVWLVRREIPKPDDEADERSAWTRSGKVTLDAHATAVADRSTALTRSVGITGAAEQGVREAALWHDVGKEDERFQRVLGYRGGPLLAKSGRRSPRAAKRAWADSGIPPGWRHELASAAAFWEAAQEGSRDQDLRDLVVRLVGTSHGLGRPTFNHDAQAAGPGHMEALRELVDEGEWEAVIARTDRRWGPWGTAYLEALLRAADCSISSEGK